MREWVFSLPGDRQRALRHFMKTVSAAVIENDGRVLIARRKPTDTLGGFWEFPGGKVEGEETPQECLKREISEELGVDSEAGDEICRSIYEYEHGAFEIIAIKTSLKSFHFKLSSHDKADFIEKSRLLEFNLLPADIPIAEKIMEMKDALTGSR